MNRVRENLQEPLLWFPITILISFSLLMIAYGQVLPSFNQHFGSVHKPLELDGKTSPEGSIWLSLTRDNEFMLAMTDQHKILRWKRRPKNLQEISELRDFLQGRYRDLMFSAVLAKRIFLNQSMVVLAIDKDINFADIRPILYLLGQMGFSRYAFETKKPHT